ncbi:MAG: ABC transporter ATP-binding protein [Armatimonadota bacterium]|nr:ABC transporter ATP-binding protein [Armatimonadota bacterium]
MAVGNGMAIAVADLTKRFAAPEGEVLLALDQVSFAVRPNEFVSIIGPSGCGKTTLLQILDGLVRPERGEVLVHGSRVTGPGPDRAMVFQDFALLPWATVLHNVAFPLEIRGVRREEREHRARQVIATVGLAGFEGYYPHALSGGMQQRVGLARALVVNPDTLLMDEPFGALDAQTRHELQDELLQLWQEHPKTVVLVTHDMEEAVYLSDRILVLTPRPGRIAREIVVPLARPRDVRVRRTAAFAELVENVWESLKGQSTS